MGLDGVAHDLNAFVAKRLRPLILRTAQGTFSQAQMRSLNRRLNQATAESDKLYNAAWTSAWVTIPQRLEFCPSDPECLSTATVSGVDVYQKSVDGIQVIAAKLIQNEYRKIAGAASGKKLTKQLDALYGEAKQQIASLNKEIEKLVKLEEASGACKN
jgi:hypothetical protein